MKNNYLRAAVVAASMLVLPGAQAKNAAKELRADNEAVRYVGRTLTDADGSVSFDWVGTYLETRLKGSSLDIRLTQKDTAYYNVFVDGELHRVLKVYGKDSVMRFVSGLKGGSFHDVRIQKRTEGEYGLTTIKAFLLPRNGSISKPSAARTRHIEFIGNSLTCGYGVEGGSAQEHFKLGTENCDLSYAAITARYFDADYTLIAHSGRGVVRNYGDERRTSEATMADRMLRTLDTDSALLWRSHDYKPDLVVINLGTNDFSTEPHPYKSEFVKGYVRILRQIRECYGGVPVLCMFCPTITAPVFDFYEAAVAEMGDKDIRLLRLPAGLFDESADYGSDWHPNRTGQRKLAMSIIPTVSTMMGWGLDGEIR